MAAPAIYDGPVPLLSFIYRAYTDGAFQDRFKSDPEGAMDEYQLTWEQKIAIYNTGADPMFLTVEPVAGFPILIDPTKISASASKGQPNPVAGDWWASYARYRAEKEAGGNPPPVPSPGVFNRPEGDRVSMAGVMVLLAEELSKKAQWRQYW